MTIPFDQSPHDVEAGPQHCHASHLDTQLRLHLIECSLKDATDLVHALLSNLGSAQAALSIPPVDSTDSRASNRLRTCEQLTRLLAGAVELARRDACSDLPRPHSVPLGELLLGIGERFSAKYDLDTTISAHSDLSDVLVQVDPEMALYALERVSDDVCTDSPGAVKARISAKFNGSTATIAFHWQDLDEPDRPKIGKDSAVARVENFRSGRKFSETMATCRALLARQGVEIDVGLDSQRNIEVAIALPAHLHAQPTPSDVGTGFATCAGDGSSPAEYADEAGRKRSGKMIIQSNRFGSIEVDAEEIISFPRGIIGFADEHEFVLVRTNKNSAIGWLQSAGTPGMALPVVSAHVLVPKYPDVDIESYSEAAGLGCSLDELAVLVVLNAPPGIPATVNLVAPIIVNASTRKGAQLLLEGSRFTTREIFMLPAQAEPAAQGDVQAATSAAE